VFKPEELPESWEEGSPLVAQMAAYGREPAKPVVVNGSLVDPEQGKAIYTAPTPPKEEKRHLVTTTGPDGRPMQRLATEAELAAGVPSYREPRQPREDNEPLMAVIGDDGRPVYMPRSQAAGRTPASNREQGRPVTSGDAGRIADINTSLDDLAVLRDTLTGNDATGTSAAIGAALPSFITEATGAGMEAKQKQATIDRVKQVIGKALEGGVLRKEDEYKYEKILPTIKDPPEVVASKLTGLETALVQRQRTFVESLADAGYDTAAYSARPRGPAGAAPPPPSGAPVRVTSREQMDALPSGTMFVAPDGSVRRKP
jgi:hypothetical protein